MNELEASDANIWTTTINWVLHHHGLISEHQTVGGYFSDQRWLFLNGMKNTIAIVNHGGGFILLWGWVGNDFDVVEVFRLDL